MFLDDAITSLSKIDYEITEVQEIRRQLLRTKDSRNIYILILTIIYFNTRKILDKNGNYKDIFIFKAKNTEFYSRHLPLFPHQVTCDPPQNSNIFSSYYNFLK